MQSNEIRVKCEHMVLDNSKSDTIITISDILKYFLENHAV